MPSHVDDAFRNRQADLPYADHIQPNNQIPPLDNSIPNHEHVHLGARKLHFQLVLTRRGASRMFALEEYAELGPLVLLIWLSQVLISTC
jgi:hypothetical protein